MSRRSAAADRRASRRSPWGDRRGWGKRGEEKEGDDMWGPHVSELREMIVAGAFWSIQKLGGRIGTPATRPDKALDVHNGVFPTTYGYACN